VYLEEFIFTLEKETSVLMHPVPAGISRT
jgi:hypothetical protein